MMIKRLSLPFVAMAFLMGGCGGGKDAPSTDTSTKSAPAAKTSSSKRVAFPKDQASATISGTVSFDGPAPKAKRIKIQGDAVCEGAHSGGMTTSQSLLVDKNTKAIQNVFVYIKKGTEGWDFPTPSNAVTVDQKGCMYNPHVFGVMAGQSVSIKSSDATTHNVHFVGKMNAEFNMTQKQGQIDLKSFSRQEVMAKLKCDIHAWMGAYVGILYHPFYQVTESNGSFSLGKLPAGEYVVEAWHETLGTQTQTVSLGAGKTENIIFKFSKS